MSAYQQKWAIIGLLEYVPDDVLFDHTSTPLHVTLAGVFKIDKTGLWLASQLEQVLHNTREFKLSVGVEVLFGLQSDVPVSKLSADNQITALHETVFAWLDANGAVFNEPQYQNKGFVPHITVQPSGRFHENDIVTLQSLSIVDLFPDSDGEKRRIIKTVPFQM